MTTGLPDNLPENPMPLANRWYEDAIERAGLRNPNAMTLASVGGNGQPSARIVLCKAFVTDPGYVVFYTNYESQKGRELAANPQVALVFHWDALGRQLRIEGPALRSPEAENDAYFASRPWGSQLGAWGSDQSRPLASRNALIRQVRARAEQLGIALGANTDTLADGSPPAISRPPHWGGFRVWVHSVELWAEGTDRVHDRARWERTLEPADAHNCRAGRWTGRRLQP